MLIKGLKRPYYPKEEIVKKERWEVGNADYPQLKHGPEFVRFKDGRYRITEKKFEYLEHMVGYKPSPEVGIKRKIQVKQLWWWKTLSQYTYKVNTMQFIRATCFGERYDYEPDWIRVGFGEQALNELIRKDQK